MDKFERKIIQSYLSRRRGFVTRMTDKESVMELIRRLRPIDCGKQLIRVGPAGDGGYLVPDDLQGIEACFSPGTGDLVEFEEDCVRRGMKAFLADRSLDRPPELTSGCSFIPRFIGATTDDEFITLDDWVEQELPGSRGDLLLQIDIEGYEYETLLSASDSLMKRFRMIVGEFHNLDQLWNQPFFQIASRVFDKILKTHVCVHNHPNNLGGLVTWKGVEIPRTTELSFIRRDRATKDELVRSFPHPLDADNDPGPPLPLPAIWHG